MYGRSNQLEQQKYDKLQIQRLVKQDHFEVLGISLEKGAVFPEHSSPTDAHLIMIEGDIDFYMDGRAHNLKTRQLFNFPKAKKHWVKANENAKFLIIR